MMTEQENDDIWENLQSIFSENPQGFFKTLSTINEEQGLKMFKAINLIRDEIVMIREMMIQKGQTEYIKRMNSTNSNKSKQQFEIKVFDKYLCKKTQENALIWLELEYCQMGSIHELVQITKLAFSEGEIAFMVDQIMKYLQELQRDGLLKEQRPLLDSRHLFLTNQGVLKIFPFPLFSQLVKNENLVSEINCELIQLISFMDNNISGNEDNFSEGIKILVKALKEDQDYSQILKTKIIQENRDKFEYIKRSIYSTRKRAIENYRKTSMSKFVPDTLKNGQNESTQINQQLHINELDNLENSKKQMANYNGNDYDDVNSDGSPSIKDSKFQGDKKMLQNNYRSNHMPNKKYQVSNQHYELSQDLKDISQINAFQNPYFSSLESNGSICQYLLNSQSIQSRNNTNNYPSFLFQSGTIGMDFYNLNDLKSVTDRRLEDEEKETQKDFLLNQNDNQVKIQKSDHDMITNNYDIKGQQQIQSNNNCIKIKQFLENHSEKKLKVKLFVKEKKELELATDNKQFNNEETSDVNKNSANQQNNNIKSDQGEQNMNNLYFSPQKNVLLTNQSFISPDRESNFSNESCKITARSERQFGQVQQELAVEKVDNIKIQNNSQTALNMVNDKLDSQQINEGNVILEESSEIVSSFPQSPYTNRKISQSGSESQKKYSPKLEYVEMHPLNLRGKISSSSEDKYNQELENKKFITLGPIYDQQLDHKNEHETKILNIKPCIIQRVENYRYESQQNQDSKQQCDTEQYNTNEVIVQDDHFESFDLRGEDENENDHLDEDYGYDKRLYEPVSSVIPQEYETFGGGSTTVAPTNDGTNVVLTDRNGDCIEQTFQKVEEYQEQEFGVSCIPTSRCNHVSEQKYQQNKNSLKFNYQEYTSPSQGQESSQQQDLSQSDSEEEDEEINSIQSNLAEEWRMKKPYAFPSNGNIGIYIGEQSKDKQRNYMKRSNSEHIDIFTLKDYMMQKRNSSPAGKQFKKTESPKVEMPSAVQSPESSASPSSSSKQQSARQPFQIRNLQQIICHSVSSKNDSRKYAYRTNDADDQDQESTTFNNPTDCNDTFQQLAQNEQNYRKQYDIEDEEHLSNYQSKKRNLSTPFTKNQRKPIFSDIQTVNSRSQSRNYFYDSKDYDPIPSSSKPSDQKQINLSGQSYSIVAQQGKNKSSNAAVNYKNRKINEGSIDISTNQSFSQNQSACSKLFPTQQSSEKELSYIKNNLFAQIENLNYNQIPANNQAKVSQNYNVINASINISSDQNYPQISKQNSYLQLEQTPKQSNQKLNGQYQNKQNLEILSQENQPQQNLNQLTSQQSNYYLCESNYPQAQSCQNAFRQQIQFDHNQKSQISSAQNLDQNSLLSPSNLVLDSNKSQTRQNSLSKFQQQNQQFQQPQQQQQYSQFQINQQNPLYNQLKYNYQNIQQQQQQMQPQNINQQTKLQPNQPTQQIHNNLRHNQLNINHTFQEQKPNNQFNPPIFYNNQNSKQQLSDEKQQQQYSILYNPLSPINQMQSQQINCFSQVTPINQQAQKINQNTSLSQISVQNTNRPISSEKINLIAQKSNNNHLISMLFPKNNKKSLNDSSLNEGIAKRKYGKDLTNKFNEEGEYIGRTVFEQGIKQLGPSLNMDAFDTLSTDESVQVKGVSLMRPGFIQRNNFESQQLEQMQQQYQLSSAKQQNQNNLHMNNQQLNYRISQNKQNNQQNNNNNNSSMNSQEFSRNIANKLFN